MKFLSFCLVATIAAVSAQAQKGAYIKAGLNLANVSVNDEGRVDDANQLTSFHVGIVGDVALGKIFSLQPGILFTGKGSQIQSGTVGEVGYYKQTSNPYYIEVPVNLVLKAPLGSNAKLFAGAGPYLGIGVGGKNKTEGRNIVGTYNRTSDIAFSNDDPTTLSEEEGTGFNVLRRFDYGLNGTAGIEGKSIVLIVNYGLGLAKLQSGANSNENNNNKHRVLSFGVGFKF